MKAMIVFIVVLAVMQGCGVKRRSRTEYRQAAQTERMQTDSLRLGVHSLYRTDRLTAIRHIRLAKPDSTGRQAVESVTEIGMTERAVLRDSVAKQLVRHQAERAGEIAEAVSEAEKETAGKRGRWLGLGLLVVAVAGVWGWGRYLRYRI